MRISRRLLTVRRFPTVDRISRVKMLQRLSSPLKTVIKNIDINPPCLRNVFIATAFFFFLCCRHRKDELERRMSALQESRRELMVQLEGLMRLLKVKAVDRFG